MKAKKKLKKKIDHLMDGGGSKHSKTGKVVAAAGLATAGILGAAALARRTNGQSIYHVLPHGEDGWAITMDGANEPLATFARKRSALAAARTTARKSTPSTLLIHDKKGKVLTSHAYASGNQSA
jgi:hypothetical protein